MRILLTGASGLIGTALKQSLNRDGHEVIVAVRRKSDLDAGAILWNPAKGELQEGALEGVDAIINLAGENVASGRWTASKKERIRRSRVEGTRLLAQAIRKLKHPPNVWINASAIGYYGSRGDEVLTEESGPGEGFLSDVCREWEEAADQALASGVRVVKLRFGVVLSPKGGALGRMLPPFKWGVGGILGSGNQYMSWVALEDVVGALCFALTHERLEGVFNVVSPEPVTNIIFTKTLGAVLHRPTIFPMPAFVVRTLFGEMGEELLLASSRVIPQRLERSGYPFKYSSLKKYFQDAL